MLQSNSVVLYRVLTKWSNQIFQTSRQGNYPVYHIPYIEIICFIYLVNLIDLIVGVWMPLSTHCIISRQTVLLEETVWIYNMWGIIILEIVGFRQNIYQLWTFYEVNMLYMDLLGLYWQRTKSAVRNILTEDEVRRQYNPNMSIYNILTE